MKMSKLNFIEFRDKYVKANTEKERARIYDEMISLIGENQNEFNAFYEQTVRELKTKVIRTGIKQKLSPILPMISTAYIAKNYFGKTASWFSQRLNGSRVNGKQATFTDDEISRIEEALSDISQKLAAVKLK